MNYMEIRKRDHEFKLQRIAELYQCKQELKKVIVRDLIHAIVGPVKTQWKSTEHVFLNKNSKRRAREFFGLFGQSLFGNFGVEGQWQDRFPVIEQYWSDVLSYDTVEQLARVTGAPRMARSFREILMNGYLAGYASDEAKVAVHEILAELYERQGDLWSSLCQSFRREWNECKKDPKLTELLSEAEHPFVAANEKKWISKHIGKKRLATASTTARAML